MTESPPSNAPAAAAPCTLGHGPTWQERRAGDARVLWSGAAEAADRVAAAQPTPDAIARALDGVNAHYGVIVETPNAVVAAVDLVRTRPIFYAAEDGFVVGDDARAVRAAARATIVDRAALDDGLMAGYATGPHTLYRGLKQLQAGEYLVWDKAAGRPQTGWHFEYRTHAFAPDDEATLSKDLGAALDAAIDRTIAYAAGRPIWVPLSGGLDSRLLLAKLAERGYASLAAFSYGPRGNREAAVARKVAARLRVPWRYVPVERGALRRFHASPERRAFWDFADGLSSVPFSQDLHVLAQMRADSVIPDDAVIVNGQTGDFISGGHVPRAFVDAETVTADDLVAEIMNKHLSLWDSRRVGPTGDAAAERVRAALGLASGETLDAQRAAMLFELWEYRERQAKFVVNGQRAYEFLGLDWHLPLWDPAFVRFWRAVPLKRKANQRLYRGYFADWDYAGVYSDFQETILGWSRGQTALIMPASVLTRLLLGRARRDRLLRYLKYFDRQGEQFRVYGFGHFARHAQDIRNVVALYAADWLASLGLDPNAETPQAAG